MAIEVHNIVKKFYSSKNLKLKDVVRLLVKGSIPKDITLFDGLDLVVPEGQVIGLIGGNGAGKSTLLKMICGVMEPDAGSIKTKGPVAAILELGAGLNQELTGKENIYFVASMMGIAKHEIDGLVPVICDFADIGDYMDMPVKTFSSGMKARLSFSILSQIEPSVLILDEVLSVGDLGFKKKSYQKIKELMSGNTTVVLVAHDMNAIRELCDRVVVIDKGKIIFDGSPKGASRIYHKLFDETANLLGNNTVKLESVVLVDKELGCSVSRCASGGRYVLKAEIVVVDKIKIQGCSIGLSIVNDRGNAISGLYHPDAEGYTSDTIVGKISIEYDFVCDLMAGSYYINLNMRCNQRRDLRFELEDIFAFRVMRSMPNRVGVVRFDDHISVSLI